MENQKLYTPLAHLPPLAHFAKYEVFIFVGLLMAIGTLIKLLGFYEFSSDWFWFLAGVGLVVEGGISLAKQKKFEKKFKIIERDEENKSLNE